MFPTIKKQEFNLRIEKLRAMMAKKGVDLVICFSNLLDPSAVRYFTDFSAVNESAALAVPLNGEVTLCAGQAGMDYALAMNKLDGSVVKAFPEVGEVSGFEYDFEGQLDFKAFFIQLKEKYSVKKIGLTGKLIFPAVIYNKLKEVFDGVEIVDFDSELYEIRVIKSEDELKIMRTCSRIISDTFETCVPQIEKGMTEREIQALLEGTMLKVGAESYVQAFAPMVATGPVNSHVSMYRNSLRKVEESEILNLAAGVCYEGYNGVICTPYVLGKIPEKIKDAVKCAYDALNLTAEQMKDGTPADVILNTYTDYLAKKGYLEYCPYGSLHSTGMLECEAPVFSLENKRVVKKGMAMCIDAYFKGMEWGSFRIEDTYIITDKGAERITTYNDKYLPQIFKF